MWVDVLDQSPPSHLAGHIMRRHNFEENLVVTGNIAGGREGERETKASCEVSAR